MISKCHFCGKEYETYTIILCDDIECFLMEDWIKSCYYHHEKNIGVCKECRDKEFYNNPIWMIRAWLVIKAQLMSRLCDFEKEKDEKMIKITKDSIKRIRKIERNLEKKPEVIELYKKNNPAMFKEPLKDGEFCCYCGEEPGQVWINDPNPSELKEGDGCWWVCKTCKKVIELQIDLTYASVFGDTERAMKLNDQLNRIAKRTGKEIFTGEVYKKEEGGYGVSSVTFEGK
jgi:hypothetical protein